MNPAALRQPARHVPEIVLGGNRKSTLDRAIKPDAHVGTAHESKKSRTQLTMHVDDQIIFRATDLLEEIEERHQCAPSPAALREIAPRKKNDIR
jgi:hypothetical protein